MPVLTFAEAKADLEIADAAGVCPDSDAFKSRLNKSVRMLMTRGDFWGTVEKIQLCTYNGCVVWPAFVGTILAGKVSGRVASMAGEWYSFMPLSASDFCCGGFGFSNGTCSGTLRFVDDGVSPVHHPIDCGKTVYIRAYILAQEDKGAIVTIYGIDGNGQEMLTNRGDGTYQYGEEMELELVMPQGSQTEKTYREILRINKPMTQGPIRMYQYDLDNNIMYDLVTLAPWETSPMYRRSRILGAGFSSCGCSTTSCDGLKRIEVLVKLEFMPVRYDGDLVLIANRDALCEMLRSNRYSEAGDKEQSAKYELSAIHELNLEASNKVPKDKTPISVNPFGSALPACHGIGRVI